jgi:hypothetical protein
MTAAQPPEPVAAPRVTRASVRKVPETQGSKRSKKAKEPDVSLEAHASTGSPDDVSDSFCFSFSCLSFAYACALTRPFSQELLKRFVALGMECAGYLRVAKASEGAL